MKNHFKAIFAASLFGTTALASVADAQTPTDTDINPAACDELQALNEEHVDLFNEEFVVGARETVQQANAENCGPWLAEAERALEEHDGTQDLSATGGRIVVTQPEPNVMVDQADPQVTVNQPAPEVSVNQAQPEIIVRQAQPTVRVEMPRPTITIDQPQPEIIVRMPDPEVAVSTAEPQIEVRQAEPTVQVEQSQPQIAVEEPDVDVQEQADANVEINQGQAVVRQEATENQAEVSVQQGQPIVRYEQAEPNIEFEDTGEPDIQFNQSGEPNIRYEDAANVEQGEASSGDPYAGLRMGNDPVETGPAGDVMVSDIVGRNVVNLQDEQLGEIENIVDLNGRHFAVLAEGGFLGLGETNVAIPVESLSRRGDEIVLRGMTEEDIDAMPEFDPALGQPLTAEQTVSITAL